MWSLVIDLASRRPWFGFGYEAFWSPDNPEVMRIEQLLSWSVAYSHNALLETLLNGGLVLAAAMGGLLAVAFAKSLRQALAASRNYAAALAFVLLAAILFSNGTESVILARADLTWILLVSAILQSSAAPGPLTRDAPVAAVRIRG
jgi:O-antigen ligase